MLSKVELLSALILGTLLDAERLDEKHGKQMTLTGRTLLILQAPEIGRRNIFCCARHYGMAYVETLQLLKEAELIEYDEPLNSPLSLTPKGRETATMIDEVCSLANSAPSDLDIN